jgi:DNA-binding NarL/FixJ family response regulator
VERDELLAQRRQLEVLTLLEEGLSNASIARRLFITEKTAAHDVSAILRKLGARSPRPGDCTKDGHLKRPNVGSSPEDFRAAPS